MGNFVQKEPSRGESSVEGALGWESEDFYSSFMSVVN